jgi:hypothetical protein
MVSWFTFLENQPDVDHEKHQTPGQPTPGRPTRWNQLAIRTKASLRNHNGLPCLSSPEQKARAVGGPCSGAFFRFWAACQAPGKRVFQGKYAKAAGYCEAYLTRKLTIFATFRSPFCQRGIH